MRRQLTVLERNQLAERTRQGRWQHLEPDLDEVAAEIHALGRGQRQRQVHENQRMGFDRVMTEGIRATLPGFEDGPWQPDTAHEDRLPIASS